MVEFTTGTSANDEDVADVESQMWVVGSTQLALTMVAHDPKIMMISSDDLW